VRIWPQGADTVGIVAGNGWGWGQMLQRRGGAGSKFVMQGRDGD